MKKQEPLVSVGLMTYKRTEGLKVALKSITSQTYKNLEIIVSENYCPGFGLKKKIIQEFLKKDKRIVYYQHNPNKGIGFNFHFVLQKATGKYFMWAADDDTWAPSFISKLVRKLEKHPEAGVAMSGIEFFSQKNPSQLVRFLGQYNPNQKSIFGNFWAALHFPRSKYHFFICGLFKRKLLQKTFPQLSCADYGSDIASIIFFSLIAPFQYVNKILYFREAWDEFRFSKEKPDESSIFNWWREIARIFKIASAILFSPQILWYRKLYIPIELFVLLFKSLMHLIIAFLWYIIIFLNWLAIKINKLRDFLLRYIWPK